LCLAPLAALVQAIGGDWQSSTITEENNMKSAFRLLSTLICCFLLAACAGRNFVKPDPDSLKNGQTTYAEIIDRFGPPLRESTTQKNEKTIKTISYAYASFGMKAHTATTTAVRAVGFHFYNEVLVGYEFLSAVEEDNSDFDETLVPQITRGKTTRAEVIRLMGRPVGRQIAPLVKDDAREALLYI
jgi:hypothetical protein